MWNYTDKVKEYYRNPVNVGEIENPDASGEVGSLACGDSMKLTLKIVDGRIVDAKFLTFGCGSAVASASILTEMLKGKTVEEAKKISNKDIIEQLGGLPDQKIHCSVLGEEVLEEALRNYSGDDEPYCNEDIENPIICNCFGVRENTIREVIKQNQLRTVEEVTNYSKAGGGCGLCDKKIVAIITEELKDPIHPANDFYNLTKVQQILFVDEIIKKYIAVELQKDGGNIELIDVQNHQIHIKFRGACDGCKSNDLTLKNFVEKILKDHIDNDIEVINISK